MSRKNKGCQGDLFATRAARDEGIARTLEARGTWAEIILDAIKRAGERYGVFTADEMRGLLDQEPPEPNLIGAVFMRAARLGIIEIAGDAISRRTVGHGNRVKLWKLKP